MYDASFCMCVCVFQMSCITQFDRCMCQNWITHCICSYDLDLVVQLTNVCIQWSLDNKHVSRRFSYQSSEPVLRVDCSQSRLCWSFNSWTRPFQQRPLCQGEGDSLSVWLRTNQSWSAERSFGTKQKQGRTWRGHGCQAEREALWSPRELWGSELRAATDSWQRKTCCELKCSASSPPPTCPSQAQFNFKLNFQVSLVQS